MGNLTSHFKGDKDVKRVALKRKERIGKKERKEEKEKRMGRDGREGDDWEQIEMEGKKREGKRMR